MADYIGQRFDDDAALPGRYIKVPPAASAMIRDDRPIDAGAAMIIHNNLSHAAAESFRHLFCDVIGIALSQTDGWTGPVDASSPGTSGLGSISWSPSVAVRYGPFFGVEDRQTDDGTPALRTVELRIEARSGTGSSLTIYSAIVVNRLPDPPYLGATVEDSFSPSTSLSVNKRTLTVPLPSSVRTPFRARPSGGAADVLVVPYWVWIGWRSTSGSDQVLTVSGYEQRV